MDSHTKDCPKCNGTGWHKYDPTHSTVCNACCKHDKGWFELKHHYKENNGKYACKAGCGELRDSENG